MSGGPYSSLFFLKLPDLNKLACVPMKLHEEEEGEPRSKQMKTCRELVLLFDDVLACPSLDSFTDITVVVAVQFFHRGILQAFAQRNHLQLGRPQSVLAGDLQCCLSYSLISRLSPRWNKAGLHLVCGKDFLTEGGRLSAVSMELSSREGQLCMSLEANAVRLPPPTLQDLGLPLLVLSRFCSDPNAVLDSASIGGPIWCHVLPSMKKGQIVSISRQLPADGPFRTYRDLQNHWNRLYGYRLPELGEDEVVYCSVYFRPVGERLFTYPLSCIRLQPVQRFPRVDLQGVLCSFMSDVRSRLRSVCGFAAQLSGKPCYHTVNLSTAASMQVQTSEQINLTTSFFIRPVLTELPSSSLALQLSARISASQPDPAQNRSGFRAGAEVWPSSGISSASCASISSLPGTNVSISVSSSLQVFQPPSSLSSSCPLVLPTPPPQSHFSSPPKLLPIFRNKDPTRHVNVALLKVQKLKKQQSGGTEEKARVTLPTFARKTPLLAASLPPPPRPPPMVPCFRRRPKLHDSPAALQPSQSNVTHTSSLTPISRVKPMTICPPATETKPRAIIKIQQEVSSGGDPDAKYESQQNKQVSEAAGRESPSSRRKMELHSNMWRWRRWPAATSSPS
uniref:DUF4708 domain-containing protein n=1 Tax=Oryzias latipes TaxID=8090 RepID=A0A3P9M3S0_ORYLA